MKQTTEISVLRHTVQVSITEGVSTQVYVLLAAAGSAFITRFALLLGLIGGRRSFVRGCYASIDYSVYEKKSILYGTMTMGTEVDFLTSTTINAVLHVLLGSFVYFP